MTLVLNSAKTESVDNYEPIDRNVMSGASDKNRTSLETGFDKSPVKQDQNAVSINNKKNCNQSSFHNKPLLPSQFVDVPLTVSVNHNDFRGQITHKAQSHPKIPNRTQQPSLGESRTRGEARKVTKRDANSERSDSFTDESTPRLFSNEDYLKLTWVTPPSSVNSTLSHTALKKVR